MISIQYHAEKKILDPFFLSYNLHRTQIITGADSTHYKSLVQLLDNLQIQIGKYKGLKIIVWDLGLDKEQLIEIEKRFPKFCILKRFNYSQYPSWFNIKINAGEYAWKPTIIKASLDKKKSHFKYMIWLDSGNLVVNLDEFSLLFPLLNERLIYSPPSSGNIPAWTHPKTLEYFKVYEWNVDIRKFRNRSGGLLAFNISNPKVKEFIASFALLASQKDCIAPEGSSRKNHRQDQALFSLLYYQFMNKYMDQLLTNNSERYLGITAQNDVD